MVGNHPLNGWWPSWGWWLTIHGISTRLNFMSYVYVPNSKSVVHFPLVDLGWWVTILWMVVDHPGDGGWPSMTLHVVLILWVRSICQIQSLYYTSLWYILDGWWPSLEWLVTILGMVGDHPGDGGWPSMTFHLVVILWVKSMCQIQGL